MKWGWKIWIAKLDSWRIEHELRECVVTPIQLLYIVAFWRLSLAGESSHQQDRNEKLKLSWEQDEEQDIGQDVPVDREGRQQRGVVQDNECVAASAARRLTLEARCCRLKSQSLRAQKPNANEWESLNMQMLSTFLKGISTCNIFIVFRNLAKHEVMKKIHKNASHIFAYDWNVFHYAAQ